jgi:threonine/homoserine/homoserine lactone efflux protein
MENKLEKILNKISLIIVLGYPIINIIPTLFAMDGLSDFLDTYITLVVVIPAIGFDWGFIPFIILTLLYICCILYIIYYYIKKLFKNKLSKQTKKKSTKK